MIVFLKIFLAHLLGDFVLQSNAWVEDKKKKKIKSIKLFYHVLIHGVLMLLLLWDLKMIPLILAIMLSHWLIDLWKLYSTNAKNSTEVFFIDQALHIGILVGASHYATGFITTLSLPYSGAQIWLLVICLLLVSFVSAHLVRQLISNWSSPIQDSENDSLRKAGTYIGILERIFVFSFLISGNISAIGFVLAAKSIFRIGDLTRAKDRKLTEYILIGTFLSFGMAMGIGLLYLLGLQLI